MFILRWIRNLFWGKDPIVLGEDGYFRVGGEHYRYGVPSFNCTWPQGISSCPLHGPNPNAPFADCRYVRLP